MRSPQSAQPQHRARNIDAPLNEGQCSALNRGSEGKDSAEERMSSNTRRPLLTIRSATSTRSLQTAPRSKFLWQPKGKKLVRYAGPLDAGVKSKNCLQLIIPAQYSTARYSKYAYFGVHTSESPQRTSPDWSSPLQLSTAHEWLSRDRRCIAFTDSSGLRPIKHGLKQEKLRDRVHRCIRTDHMTSWVSESGGEYMLNEPYVIEDDYQLKLQAEGFASFQLPINISPYCGLWDATAGSRPGTTSVLITSYENGLELDLISQRLAAAALKLPAWNDVSGVLYV